MLLKKEIKWNLYLEVICFFLYTINKFLLNFSAGWRELLFFKNYFSDVLAGIVILGIYFLLLPEKVPRFHKSKPFCFLLILLCGITWEFIIPIFNFHSISDPLDILAYLGGYFIYELIYSFKQSTNLQCSSYFKKVESNQPFCTHCDRSLK